MGALSFVWSIPVRILLIALSIAASMAGETLACGGGFNDFVPCQTEQSGYNPFLAQEAGPPLPPISPIDKPLSSYDLEQLRQRTLEQQQLQENQRREDWHDSCPYGSFGCSTTQ
jgi:hypothetical protein